MKEKTMLYPATEYDNLRDLLNVSFDKYKDKNSFILKHKSGKDVTYENITFGDLKIDVEAVGTGLLNIGYGDKRIAIIGKNSYPWFVGYLATINGVGISVPLDKGLPIEEAESSLMRSYADVLLFDNEQIEMIKEIKKRNKTNVTLYISMSDIPAPLLDDVFAADEFITLPRLKEIGLTAISHGDDSFSKRPIDADAMSIILFTSGTTSMSKAVMLSHKNLTTNLYGLQCMEDIRSTDINMAFLPFHHTFGSTGMLLFLACGTCTVFCDGLKYLSKNLVEYKVSVFICVPLLIESIYKKILSQAEKQNKLKLLKTMMSVSNFLLKFKIDLRKHLFKSILDQLGGNLRFIVSGAAPIDKTALLGFTSLGIFTVQGYGLTETAPVLTAENRNALRLGSVGVPMCNVEIKIENPDENGVGEVWAKGPNIMLGYYENKEETDKVIKDGWFCTGDIGYTDKDGFLFLCGRQKNVIVAKNGKNIYPEEMELVINKLPYIAETMVFDLPKNDASNDIVLCAKVVYDSAYVSLNLPDLTNDQLKRKIKDDIDSINSALPVYKQLRRILITDEPTIKTTTAKTKRFEEIKTILSQGGAASMEHL